jgi:phosphopantothenoylcysteine decarboxylase/phosphopantothenate--cysteine ligase
MSGSKLLFIVTGSVAAYKACDAISKLVQAGHELRIVATPAALRFVGAATLEGLTGQPILSDLFESGRALDHIELTRWADAVIVCPATANTLNRLAAGLADDLVGALFLAHDRTKPWVIAPAMNPQMWSHPATQNSVERLREWNVQFIEVNRGLTACGEIGEGRLAEPAEIVVAVERHLARPAKPLRVLITSGGTSEPIDGVRVLTNTSTGYTGAELARFLHRHGHDVTLLRANNAISPALKSLPEETFQSCADLQRSLARHLADTHFDAVIHAAAVSDFHVSAITVDHRPLRSHEKIESTRSPILQLSPNPKLVTALRTLSRNPAIQIVAFKLTRDASPVETATAVSRLFAHSPADFVVHNDLTTRRNSAELFPSTIYSRAAHPPHFCATRSDLAASLEKILTAHVLNSAPPCSSASTSETATSTPVFTAATA